MPNTFVQSPIGATVWIELPIGRHYGRKYSDHQIIHMSKKHGKVSIDTVSEFSDGKHIYVDVDDLVPSQQEMRTWAYALKNKSYSLVQHNCEHVKEMLAGKPPSSRQVRGVVGGAAIGLSICRMAALGPLGLLSGLVIGAAVGLGTANSRR